MSADLDTALATHPPGVESARSVVRSDRPCRRHRWELWHEVDGDGDGHRCARCGVWRDDTRSRRGRSARDYGNRAELKVARQYGGEKVGHHGGPVDVRGKDFNTQVKTHRRLPPREWTAVFANLEASTDRLPRLLLRFVHPGGPTDFVVIPGKAWLDWFGRDE